MMSNEVEEAVADIVEKLAETDDPEEDANEDSSTKRSADEGKKEKTRTCTQKCGTVLAVLAGMVLNLVAGYFYPSFVIFVSSIMASVDGYTAEKSNALYDVFSLLAALSAAACAPVIIKFGYRKTALIGCAVLIYVCLSTTLSNSADMMIMSSGFIGGIAIGVVRTVAVASVIDTMKNRHTVALVLSYLGFVIGVTIAVVIVGVSSGVAGGSKSWWNGMRIFEITAVIGLLAAVLLPGLSSTTQNVPQLFRYPPFYFIIVVRFLSSMGMFLIASTFLLPLERMFPPYLYTSVLNMAVIQQLSQFLTLIIFLILRKCCKVSLKKPALMIFGILVTIAGAFGMLHEVAFVHQWPLAVFAIIIGICIASSQTLMPLALITSTGKHNFKLSFPFLLCFDEMGTLLGKVIQGEMSKSSVEMKDYLTHIQSVEGIVYLACVWLLLSGIGAIVTHAVSKRWTPLKEIILIPEALTLALKHTFSLDDENSKEKAT